MSDARAIFAVFVAALGACAIGCGVLTTEPAWIAEAQRSDQLREADLARIAAVVVAFERRYKALPYDLSKLAESQPDGATPLALGDPESGRPYDYARIDSGRYELSAADPVRRRSGARSRSPCALDPSGGRPMFRLRRPIGRPARRPAARGQIVGFRRDDRRRGALRPVDAGRANASRALAGVNAPAAPPAPRRTESLPQETPTTC